MARRIEEIALQTIEDSDGISWQSVDHYLFMGVLKGCGCGNGDELAKDVMRIFRAIATDDPRRHELIYQDKYHELIAHWLAAAELTEHGSSIGGSWLTESGKKIYAEILDLSRKQNQMETTDGPPH